LEGEEVGNIDLSDGGGVGGGDDVGAPGEPGIGGGDVDLIAREAIVDSSIN